MPQPLTIPIAAFGEQITGLTVPIGSTVHFNILCSDPLTLEPVDLSGSDVMMSVAAVDILGDPIYPPRIAKHAVNGIDGNCVVLWDPSDSASLIPGAYAFDIWLTDAQSNRLQLGVGSMILQAVT